MEQSSLAYCRRCGHKMTQAEIGGRVRLICPKCGFVLYRNPVPGVGLLVEMDDGIVLIKRKGKYGKGRWALPSGFIEADESMEAAALRECKEETGLDVELLEMFGVDSFPEGPIQSGIIIFYRARPVGGRLQAGDDAAEARVFAPDALPPDVAFRTHRAALTRWATARGAIPPFSVSPGEVYPLAQDLLIRRANPTDEAAILKLLPLIPANKEMTAQQLYAAGLRFRENTALDVLVADWHGEVVGFLALCFVSTLTNPRAWIDDVAVSPAHRRQGIGRALIEAAVQRASRRGVTHLFLDTSRSNPDTLEFYRACGFEDGGIAPLHIR
ncbi:MAG TPA: GNAT family N-acetyltransferase [Anaerolineae bacterium]|nr:GNAT family N-acetyltransferase [Anaerolineae bacterium]